MAYQVESAVITGATGMIGATLAGRLARNGIRVLAIVRPSSPKMRNIPRDPRIETLECPLDGLSGLARLNREADVFYHFAWDGAFGVTRNDGPLQNANIRHTLDAVQLAAAWGCHTFIGAGSQAEYGRVEGALSPCTPVNPETGYGIAKYAAGKLSAIEASRLGLRHMWTRILSVYGPGDNAYTMIMTAIGKLLRGEKPSFTAGDQMWDYLYSEDLAEAFHLLALLGRDRGVYCMGSGTARPLKEYICAVRDAVNPSLPLGLGDVPYADNQVMNLCADIGNLTEDTGFIPVTPFEKGIKETILWYKECLQG
jgi:nucleoside-diphosphate-sugar epimerase